MTVQTTGSSADGNQASNVQNDRSVDQDAKAMQTKYVKGATIDDLAEEYGHDVKEVERVVVTPADEEPEQVLQTQIAEENAGDKSTNKNDPKAKAV